MSIPNVGAFACLRVRWSHLTTVRSSRTRVRALLHAGVLLAALGGTAAWAASITVDSLADDIFATLPDGQCTLREAIFNADTDSQTRADCAAGSGADTITFTGAAASGTITVVSRLIVQSPVGLTIDGARAITISGGGRLGTGVQVFGGSLTLKKLTLADMREGPTGGVRAEDATLMIVDSNLLRLSTSSGFGGAVSAARSTVTVLRSTFSGNSARHGGGIEATGSRLTISQSTFVDNSSGGFGGAVDAAGDSLLTLSNSTFFDNRAAFGGGGVALRGATAQIANVTFLQNSADFAGATVYGDGSSITLRNTLLAGALQNANCFGAIIDGGGNLEDAVSCGFSQPTSKSNTPAGLDPAGLKHSGGATQTIALCSGADKPAGCAAISAAVDAGDAATCAAEPVNNLDQRGVRRPGDGNNDGNAVCDIGAFEVPSPGTRICSLLGDRRGFLDVDVFRFTGAKDEEVTLTLEELASAGNRGTRAGLFLVSGVPKVLFVRADASDLPNTIAAKLPATGRYFTSVNELPQHVPGEEFRGNYCVTLRSSMNAASSFEATETVETVLP